VECLAELRVSTPGARGHHASVGGLGRRRHSGRIRILCHRHRWRWCHGGVRRRIDPACGRGLVQWSGVVTRSRVGAEAVTVGRAAARAVLAARLRVAVREFRRTDLGGPAAARFRAAFRWGRRCHRRARGPLVIRLSLGETTLGG